MSDSVTALEGGELGIPVRRRQGTPVPRVGIRESLDAPGIVPSPPLSENAQAIFALAKAFNGFGGLVSGVAGLATQQAQSAVETANDLKRQAEEESKAAKDDAEVWRGKARQDLRVLLPTIRQEIDEGKYDATILPEAQPDGALIPKFDPSEFGAKLAVDRAGKEFGPVYGDEFVRGLSPLAAELAQARRAGLITQRRQEASARVVDSVGYNTDPAELGAKVDALVKFNPGLSRDSAETQIGARMLTNAVALSGTMPDRATKSLAAARSFLGNRLPAEQERAQAAYDEAINKQDRDRQGSAINGFWQRINDNDPLSTVRQFVKDEPWLDEEQKASLYSKLDLREQQAAHETQTLAVNGIVRDVALRRWRFDESGNPSPVATVNEIVRRMDIADPKSPDFIDADRGSALINAVQGAVKFDARVDRVRQSMGALVSPPADGKRPYVAPATPDDDAAIIRTFADAGIVDATETDGGAVVLQGVRDPVRLAFFAKGLNRVPANVQNAIRAGLTASDPAQVTEAATIYSAIYLQDPGLARSIELSPEAALRARYIVSRVERMGPNVGRTSDSLRQTASDIAAPFATNPVADAVKNAVSGTVTTAIKLDPTLAAYKPEQVLGLAYFKDADASVKKKGGFDTEIHTKAAEDIRRGVFDSEAFKAAALTPSRALGLLGNARLDNIPAPVLDSYLGYLSDEFRYAKSLTPSEELAAKGAKAWALDRALADHPPYTWNGTVFFGRKGDPSVPEEIILDDLATPPNDPNLNPEGFRQFAKNRADDLRSNYVPVWDARQQGFVFRSITDPYQLYTEWSTDSVGPLVVNPLEASNDKAADLNKQIDDVLNKRRAERATTPAAAPSEPSIYERALQYGG